MKTKIAISMIMLLSLAAVASAQPSTTSTNLQEFKQAYNQQASQVPGFVGAIVGGESVNINFKNEGSTETIGADFEGVKINEISENGVEDPSMEVNVTQDSVQTVISSDKPYQELQKELNNGGITYETKSTTAGIKIKILETLNNLASMIGIKL